MSSFQGKWIVVEGPDRIGKTTLIRNLQSYISKTGVNVMTNGFPRRTTPIGNLLDECLKSRDIVKDWKAQTFVFLADMLEAQKEMSSWREPENGSGTVITDRYTMSTYAYAKAQQIVSQSDDKWLLNAINLIPQPDVYVLLVPEDNDIDFLTSRSEFGNEVTERVDIQQKVVTFMDELVTRQEFASNHNIVRVMVGKDDTPQHICDNLVMPQLEKVFGSVDDTRMTDIHNNDLFGELIVPRVIREATSTATTSSFAANFPTII